MKPFGLCARYATAFLAALLAASGILGSTASFAQSGRLLQISTRAQVLTGDDVMIAGFVIGGPTPKTVVIHVLGPSLAGLLANPLQDPTVTLVRQSDGAVLKANDNWQSQAVPADFAAIMATGLQPTNGLEPAIIATLPQGAYTAVVSGASGTTGVAVVGVYEIDHPEVPLINIATRGKVLTGDNVMIAGFAVGPSDPRAVVVTVTGPSLATFGIANPLQNPTLTLVRSSDQAIIATNDDWQVQANPADVAAIQANGLQPADPREPAIIATLQPGLYTAIASGVAAGTGTAVVAVYQANFDVAVTSANNTTFTVGTAGTFTVTTAGSPAATSVTATGALPTGVTFTPGTTTGTLSGTPAPGTGGTYNLTITASNGGVTPNATQTFTLTVNQAPAITSANAATFQASSSNAHTVVATGFPAPTLSVTGALPPGVTFNPTNGQLAGTPTAAGTFPLVFTAANGVGANATQNFTLTVTNMVQITSANAATFTVGTAGTFTITTSATPTATSITVPGLPPGLSLSATSPTGTATISGTPTGPAGAFTLTITASNGGVTANGTQTFTLTVLAQPQTITFTSAAPASPVANGPTYNVTATATSGLAVALSIDASASGVCTIAGSTVTFIAGGTCVINANQAGNGTYAAAPQVQQSMVVAKATQTVTITTPAPGAAVVGGPTYGVAATATSGLPVTFSTSTPAVCSAAGSTISFIGAGTCTVVASQAGNAAYNPAQTTQSFAVAMGSQTITFTSVAPAAAAVGGATYAVTATATSGLPVAFTIDPAAAAVCSIAGSTVSFIGVGNCIINANQAGNANYGAAPQVQQSFAVRNAQTISFTSVAPTNASVGGATYNVTAAATSGLAVVFTIDASASTVCSLAGSTVSFIGGGTCVINANQPGNASYYAAPQVQQSFTVKSAQAITFTSVAPAAAVYQGPTYTVTATGGASGNPVTFTIDASAGTVCSVAGAVVSFIGTGTCVINANQLGNALYYPAPQVQQSFAVGPKLVGDAYSVVGNTQLAVAGHSSPATPFTTSATGILANDTSNVAIAVTAVTGVATTGGGLITINAAGALTYTPPVGQSAGTDTYVYTGTSNGVSRTATITFNIANVVWYVNRTAAPGGNGRSNTPFNTLTGAQAPSGANSYIYVHAGGAPTATTGSLVLDAGQELRGEGVAFTLGALSLAAGTRPVLSGTVTLADDTLVTGLNFVNASPALLGNGFTATQPILIDQVNVTGGTNALSLTNVNGSVGVGLTFSNAVMTNTTAAEVLVSGGNIPLNFPASTTLSGNSGRLIDIQNRTGNAVSFAGALTDTGTGIFLSNNTSTAFTFSGGMTLNGTGTTFTATNAALAGTLSITGTNNIGATTAPTSGTALNVSNIAFAAGGISFRSVHQNGGTSGIVINNTGSTAGLTVTGNGVATVGGDNSGGTLQNLSSYGIQLTSTRNVSLANMNIQSAGRSGIDGQLVTNFTFAAGRINNVGTAAAGQYEESNIAFNDGGAFLVASVDGAVSITNSILNNARRHGIQVENGSGTLSSLTITGNQLTSSTSAAASLGTAILVMPQGSAGTTAHLTTGSISSNTIANFPSGEGIAVLGGVGNSSNGTTATLGANGTPIVIGSNAINGGATRMGSNAIRATMNSQSGIANFTIQNNGTLAVPVTNIEGQGISVFMGGSITGTTTVNNNVIVANQTIGAGTQGLAVQIDDGPAGLGTSAANYNVSITNNNVSQYEGNGIRAIARASLGKMDVTITGNTVGTPILANRNGIRVDSGSAVGDVTLCLAISGNNSVGSGINGGIGIRKQGAVAATNDFGIVGLVPSPATALQAAARIDADNPLVGTVDVLSGDNFTSCTITP